MLERNRLKIRRIITQLRFEVGKAWVEFPWDEVLVEPGSIISSYSLRIAKKFGIAYSVSIVLSFAFSTIWLDQLMLPDGLP